VLDIVSVVDVEQFASHFNVHLPSVVGDENVAIEFFVAVYVKEIVPVEFVDNFAGIFNGSVPDDVGFNVKLLTASL